MNNKKQEIKRKKENLHVGGAPEGRQCHRLARSPACGDIPKGYAALNEEDLRRTESPSCPDSVPGRNRLFLGFLALPIVRR